MSTTALAVSCFGVFAPEGIAQSCPVNTPHLQGVWKTLPYLMPINPISATLLHTGKVLIVAGSENDASNNSKGSESYRNAIWDPTDPTANGIAVQEIEYDVFCSGTSALPDGRALVVGGTSDYSFAGDNRASIFDPATNEFAQSQSMVNGRWYATATTLGDGRVMTFSGYGNSGGTVNNTVEIYDLQNAGAGWTSPVTAPFSPALYPPMFVLPNGKVFYTGQGGGRIANSWIFDPLAKSWSQSVATTMDRHYGSSVLLPLLPPNYTPRVMNFGGGSPATSTTEIIDLSAASPKWTAGPPMSTGRIEMNAVILPNGKVLAEGGSVNNESPDAPGKKADIYDPVAGTMTSGGTAAYSRLYHSTALLLPDATVMSMGSNPGNRGGYEPAIEIYTPPYLFDANDNLITTDRPVITGVTPGVIGYNATFYVNYTSNSAISSAVLVRLGSATHTFDMDQRLIGLCGPSPQPTCVGSGQLNLTTPPNGNIAPPGYYMLFVLDSAGVPSVAQIIQLSPYTTSAPKGVISSPASDMTIVAGQSVSFATTTTSAKYSWVFPSGSPATSTAQNPGNVRFSTPGEYTVSLTEIDATGNSDPSPPTRTITVLPASADFDISISPSANTVLPGNSSTFNVTVTPLSGFTGTVALSVGSESGFPTGITSGGFSPSSISGGGSSTLTMNTTTSAAPYALSLTVTGTSGTITHTGSTTLLVNLAAPASLTATPNGAGQIALSWPASVSATSYHLKRSLVSGGPYTTVACTSSTSYTDSAVSSGTTYYYVVSAAYSANPNAGGESADSSETSATSQPSPSFSISASPNSVSIQQGNNGSVTINTSALNGFNNTVALSVSGLPANVTPTFNPTSIAAPGTGSSTLGLAVGAGAATGTYTLTVTGTGGGVTQTATVTLTITAGASFSISASPNSVSVQQGSNGSVTINTSALNGFNNAVALSVSGQPANVTPTFNPTSIAAPGTGSSSLGLAVGAGAATGTYTLTVTGTGGGVTKTTTVTLTITAGASFSISASPSSLSVQQGKNGSVTINTSALNGFNNAVALSVSGLPANVTPTFTPASIAAPGTGSSTLGLAVGAGAATGTYTLTVTGTGGGVTKTTTVTLTITAGPSDFTIGANPISITATLKGASGSTTISAIVLQGAPTIALSASGQPKNVNVTFSPTSVTGSTTSLMTVKAVGKATPGTYTLTITGSAGGVNRTTNVTLTVK